MPFPCSPRLLVLLAALAGGTAAGTVPAADAQVPGANGRIAFDRDRDGNRDVFTMAPDGTDERRLTKDPARDFAPSFSPDGTRIAFVSTRDGNAEIYLMDADGTHQARLTRDPGRDDGPTFSPDGTRIAFVSDRPGDADLFTIDLAGGSVAQLTTGPTDESGPAYSPDGRRIAFTSNAADGQPNIWSMPAVVRDGPHFATQLTTGRGGDAEPSYSPDGRHIAFTSSRDAVTGGSPDPAVIGAEVYTMDADGRHPRRLTRNAGPDGRPSYSPDGSLVVHSGVAALRTLGVVDVRDRSLGDAGSVDERPSWASVSRPPVCPDTVLHVPARRAFRAPLSCRDPDHEPFALTVAAPPAHGTAAPDGEGGVAYTPDHDFTGWDAFRVTARDRRGATSAVATVRAVVAPFALDRVALRHAVVTARHRAILTYRLSAAARVRLTARGAGRTFGPVRGPGRPGHDIVAIGRRFARRALAPGRYRLTVAATLPDGPTLARTVLVTVAP